MIEDDISVAANGNIRYTGTTVNYTVIEFHRFLQDLADDASSSGDDLLDITNTTPSDRSTDNIITIYSPYNIDDTLAQHLYDGSIIQDGGDTVYDGIVNFGAQGIHIEILQNGGLVTPNFWASGLNADPNAGISHRFMVKTRTAAADIDGRRLIGMNREFNYTYSEFSINGTARGNNVLALTHAVDLNNQTDIVDVAGWSTITNTEGYSAIDVTGDGVDEYYYSEWNKDSYSINQLFERAKWLTRRGSTSTLYGLNGDLFRGITHEITVDTNTGNFEAVEPISWTGGTGQMLAVNNEAAPTKMWIQLLTGVAPSNGQTITGTTSTATCDVNETIISRTISQPFVGASTGSAIIGSYGLGIEASDLSSQDKLFDLDNVQNNPPNNVTFIVGGLVSGEDRIIVGPETGGNIDVSQLSISGAYVGGESTFTVQETIPSDTPSAGTFRCWNGDTYSRVTFTSWSGSTFAGCAGVPACINGDNIWISYIDELASGTSASFTTIYSTDRSLFIRVRDGGLSPIKTFETTGTLGVSGGSSTAIRTSDE
jgi:hypothetical protein